MRVSETGDQNNPKRRTLASRFFGQFNPGHPRHADVGNHHAQSGLGGEQGQSLRAILRFNNTISRIDQEVRNNRTHILVIVNDYELHPILAPLGCSSWDIPSDRTLPLFCAQRQPFCGRPDLECQL